MPTDQDGRTVWQEIHWPRPLEVASVLAAIRAWAADQHSPTIVLEARAQSKQTRYLLGCRGRSLAAAAQRLTTAVPGTRLTNLPEGGRQPVAMAGRLKLSTRHRSLVAADPEITVRQLLGALATSSASDISILQLILGPRRIPLAVPNNSPSSIVRPWYDVAWSGNGGTVDPEKRSALRDKVSDHGFAATLRIGAFSKSGRRADAVMTQLASAIRTLESPGLQARIVPESAHRLNVGQAPTSRFGALGWPLRLNVGEVVSLSAWPLGKDDLPGLASAHPRRVAPTVEAGPRDRIVAAVDAPGAGGSLGYSVTDSLRHSWFLGPTGTGKSSLLLNLICQDMNAGRAVVVIEPNDLVADVLERIPKGRRDDVVLVDPLDDAPVGINVMDARGRSPELVADSLLATIQSLYGGTSGGRSDALGPRSTDILSHALQALASYQGEGGTSLVMLPLLLTNPGFRRSVTQGVIRGDPLTAGPFWSWFEALSDEARSQIVAPLMNKLRPLLRPSLRRILGQRRPQFNIRQVLQQGKILLVPLQKGVVGPDTAELLGSLVVAELWLALRERRGVPEDRRRPVMIYIDECQEYLKLPGDLADALATSRSLRAGWHLAHQFTGQLSPSMLAAFESNARSRICFQLAPRDARLMASGQSVLDAEDFISLPAFHIYAALVRGGQVMPWASGKAIPKPAVTSNPDDIRTRSRRQYGRPLDDIEADFASLIGTPNPSESGPAGRRRRST